ncbi:MAG: exodeoxyribonuclease VII large subunit [Nitrospira sp.]|nr:MAG: exodeoxyribonuclease VII large subunit [Nitrospira sp.]
MIFKSTALRLRFGLEDGLHVIVRGRVTVYELRGEYQIILEHMEPKGRGALQLAFEQLKNRLAAEGLFDQDRKRPLPAFPRTIGIVTSPAGAAVQDIIAVLHRRCPILEIIIAPVQVQGDGAAAQIASAIRSLNELGHVDVIIVGRGGGSLEDLWSFNEELVVRAIVASRIPVVSAVGHETDVTLADFAADMRAPTPSAAAEAVTPVLSEVVEHLGELSTRCGQAMSWRCGEERQRLDLALAHLANTRFRILEEAQRVDGAVVQMRQAVQGVLRRGWEKVHSFKHELVSRSPEPHVRHGMTLVPQLLSRLEGVMRYTLNRRKQAARSCLTSLNNLSPLGILDRGYSIVETVSTHQVIRDASQVSAGQEVVARLAKGQLRCTVEEVMTDPSV